MTIYYLILLATAILRICSATACLLLLLLLGISHMVCCTSVSLGSRGHDDHRGGWRSGWNLGSSSQGSSVEISGAGREDFEFSSRQVVQLGDHLLFDGLAEVDDIFRDRLDFEQVTDVVAILRPNLDVNCKFVFFK